jgi:transcription initiation factor TFIIH subunit 1
MAGRGFCTAPTLTRPFPEPKIGRGLLEALTKKMSADSKTEADVQELANTLPEEFKTQLATFFRRASELLRHFFSLRSVFGEDDDENGRIGHSESQKQRLANIVKGMEKVCNSLLLLYFLSYESKSRY